MFSRRYFRYLPDDTGAVAILRDESATELLNDPVYTQATVSGLERTPTGLTCRNIKLKTAAGNTKTVTILARSNYDAINVGDTYAEAAFGEVAAQTPWVVTAKIPERFKGRAVNLDTGMVDGDNP
jgi:hypothetical protein